MRLKLLFLILLLTNLLPLAAQRGTVKGRVWNARNNEALIGAVVRMEGTKRATVTDSVGNYVFKNVAPGFYHLAVQLLGFENKRTEEFQVLGNQNAFVDVELSESAFSLTEAVVKSDTQAKRAESPLSVSRLEIQQIEKSAGMNRDVSKLIQTLPGVVSTDANRNDLLVRGGGPAENVFYLEGIELPVINHFSTQGAAGGAVGILNPDFMSAVDFYTGAFPANRPNALSSVMDIRMKEASRDRLHTKVSLGASDASVTLDGPINARSSFIVSARQSYLKVLFKWFGLPFLPTYNDFQLKYNYRIGTHSSLTVIGLASIDHMRLNTELDESAQEIRRFLLNVLPTYDQWHYTIGAVYKVAATTHTDRWVLSRNFLDNGSHKYPGNDASLPKLFDYLSQESENKLRFERTFWTLPFKLNVGAGVQHARYFNRTQRYRIEAGVPTVDHYESNLHLFAYSAFAQASKALVAATFAGLLRREPDGQHLQSDDAHPPHTNRPPPLAHLCPQCPNEVERQRRTLRTTALLHDNGLQNGGGQFRQPRDAEIPYRLPRRGGCGLSAEQRLFALDRRLLQGLSPLPHLHS